MKSLNHILLMSLLSLLVGFSSCSDDDDAILQRSHDALEFSYLNSTEELLVLSNGNWSVSSEDSWVVDISPSQGNGDGKNEQVVKIRVSNNDGDARTGSINLSNGDKNLIIKISQEDGHFIIKDPIVPASFDMYEEVANGRIEIPYQKAKPGYVANVTPTITGPGAEGLTIQPVTDYMMETGEGAIPLYITGIPTVKGAINLEFEVEIISISEKYNFEAVSRSKLAGELVVTAFKVLPRLAVMDWGKYKRGSGQFGDNGTSRSFIIELAETEEGPSIRRYYQWVDWLTSTSNNNGMFFDHNRFVLANLEPNKTYWFRIIATKLGPNKDQESDKTAFEFKTPAEEPLSPNVLLYKDFDNFWFGGCPIYMAFGVHPLEAEFPTIDPNSAEALGYSYRTNHPMVNIADLFAQKNSTTHNISPTKSPALWNFFWEGDKYGTNYGDADYTGWTGSLAMPNSGGVRLSSASQSGHIKTPTLSEIGEGTANITVTVNTAPYFEPYHNWGEDHLQHYIQIEGPGTITNGGATKAEPTGIATANSDKQVTVQCTSNVDKTTRGPLYEYTIPTTHTIKVTGATKDTRVVIRSHPYGTGHYRVFVDDIKITKD